MTGEETVVPSSRLRHVRAGQSRKAAKLRKERRGTPVRGLLPLVLALTLWQLLGADESAFFPRPSTWVTEVRLLVQDGSLWPAFVATCQSLLTSLLLATAVGAIIGLAVGASQFLDRALGPTLEFFRATPSSAMVPIAVLLLGYSATMKSSVTVLAAMWPILLNARAAMRELHPTLLDVAAMLHMTRWRKIRTIILPAVSSSILLGIRVGTPIALIVTLLVEILTGVPGLGALLGQAQQEYNSAASYGLLILIGLLALVFNGLIGWLESWLTRHLPPA
jgi:ABC-type nitrate/sulfonate/bicarbonate transport system permease component